MQIWKQRPVGAVIALFHRTGATRELPRYGTLEPHGCRRRKHRSMADTIIELDVKGYNCPIPLLRAKKALANMAGGELIRIVTTDPGAEIDFRVFAEATGNELVSVEERSGVVTL